MASPAVSLVVMMLNLLAVTVHIQFFQLQYIIILYNILLALVVMMLNCYSSHSVLSIAIFCIMFHHYICM